MAPAFAYQGLCYAFCMDESTPRSFRAKKVSWLTIILAALAVISFLAISAPDTRYYMGGGGVTYSVTSNIAPMVPRATRADYGEYGGSGSAPAMMPYKDYYPYQQDVAVTDTREFLKVSYGAQMKTRHVQNLARRVETTVRGYSGRIDQESVSPQSGYISFVVPMSKYENFRSELESLVGTRFLSVNVSSQNLLPQKQSIEEQQKQADTTLAEYKASRQSIISAHTSTVRSLQSQIDSDNLALASLRAQPQTYETQVQIQTISQDLASLQAQLSRENASYAAQLKNADASIKQAEDWQKAVKTQDQALLDNVATVSGSVSIQWISLWDVALLYLPGYSIPAIFAVLAFLSYLWDRRRFGTV